MPTPSPLTAANVVPPDSQALWEATVRVLADWGRSEVSLTSSFASSVRTGDSDAETRRLLNDRLAFAVSAEVRPASLKPSELSFVLARAASARSLWPLFPDALVGSMAASTSISGDFRFRRFWVGGRVMIASSTGTDVVTVGAVGDSSLTLADSTILTGTVIVVPLFEAELLPSNEYRLLTDGVGIASVQAAGVRNDSCPTPWMVPGTYSGAFQTTSDGKPIWRPNSGLSWKTGVGVSWTRRGEINAFGTTTAPAMAGSRPSLGFRANIDMERADFWDLWLLWNYAAGRVYSFYLVLPQPIGKVLSSPSATKVTVPKIGESTDWAFVPFVDIGGYVYKVASVVTSETTHEITLDSNYAGSINEDVRPCHRVRFTQDSLSEGWRTGNSVGVDIDLIEVSEERTVAIPNIPIREPDPGEPEFTVDSVITFSGFMEGDTFRTGQCLPSSPSDPTWAVQWTTTTPFVRELVFDYLSTDVSAINFIAANGPFDMAFRGGFSAVYSFNGSTIDTVAHEDCLLLVNSTTGRMIFATVFDVPTQKWTTFRTAIWWEDVREEDPWVVDNPTSVFASTFWMAPDLAIDYPTMNGWYKLSVGAAGGRSLKLWSRYGPEQAGVLDCPPDGTGTYHSRTRIDLQISVT